LAVAQFPCLFDSGAKDADAGGRKQFVKNVAPAKVASHDRKYWGGHKRDPISGVTSAGYEMAWIQGRSNT
jgi:hypothetical protein